MIFPTTNHLMGTVMDMEIPMVMVIMLRIKAERTKHGGKKVTNTTHIT